MQLMVRENLIAAFDPTVSNYRLACLIAPAGYGKSTLMFQFSERLSSLGIPTGWIRVNQEHDDPVRFLAYLGAALKPLGLNIDPMVAAQLYRSQASRSNTVLNSVVRELSSRSFIFG